MTTVHVVPTGEPPENHTLDDCPCGPTRRRIQIGDICDWIIIHRAAVDELDVRGILVA